MTLRAETIRERLRKMREILLNLMDVRQVSRREFLASYRHYWLAERGLQLAAEAVFDIGNHILAGHFNLHSSNYEDVIQKLTEQGVLSSRLREELRGLGGFRNVLVHGYLDVDMDRVWTILHQELDRFEAFAQAIEEFLESLQNGTVS